jgi:3-keto-5-aminohexanoate cleavage enzyme
VIHSQELPRIMVAPTGARRTKADHPLLPMTADEIVGTAAACFAAGAGAIHAHVRDAEGGHSLDIGLYADLVSRLRERVPGMLVQISTEAVGIYTPEEQIALVRALKPAFVSVALREIFPEGGDEARAVDFYSGCKSEGISVQHILYDAVDVLRLAEFQARYLTSTSRLSVIYVLGRYAVDQESGPQDLEPFLDAALQFSQPPDWMVCAFGRGETDCLAAALAAGGKVRVGFENSFWHSDGRIASSNAERVATIREIADRMQEGRRA